MRLFGESSETAHGFQLFRQVLRCDRQAAIEAEHGHDDGARNLAISIAGIYGRIDLYWRARSRGGAGHPQILG